MNFGSEQCGLWTAELINGGFVWFWFIAITVMCSILPPLLACSFSQMFAVQLLKTAELVALTD